MSFLGGIVCLAVIFATSGVPTSLRIIFLSQMDIHTHILLELFHESRIDHLIQRQPIVLLEIIVHSPTLLLHVECIILVVDQIEVVRQLVDSHSGLIGSQGGKASC